VDGAWRHLSSLLHFREEPIIDSQASGEVEMAAGGDEKDVCVHLYERHVACLNRLGEEIQSATGAAIGPSEIIRALVEALDEAGGVDPTLIESEEDLVEVFYRRFTRQEDPPRDRDRMRSG
jgi:hypothetical protein